MKTGLAILAALAVGAAAARIAGVEPAGRNLPPPEAPVAGPAPDLAVRPPAQVESTFLMFGRESVPVPVVRYGRGGALTMVDGLVVVLTMEGRLFAATSAADLHPLAIATPDYNFAAYKAFAEDPRNAGYIHALWGFRYADLLAFRHGGRTRLALTYTHFDAERVCYRTILAVLDIPGTAAELDAFRAGADDWQTLFRAEPCLPLRKGDEAIHAHAVGGRLAWDGAGTLFLASGDYFVDGVYIDETPLAPDPAADYGKVIAIDVATGAARHISRGHRNTQGIAFDRDGALWVSEHGMRGGDELNLILDGRDYGWPRESLGTLYNRLPIPGARTPGRHDTFEAPRLAFLPSIAPSSLILIAGFHPAWDGDLLLATLNDRALWRLRIAGGHVTMTERIPVDVRVRDVEQVGPDRLALLTDDRELVFLTRLEAAPERTFLADWLARPELAPEARARLARNLDRCLECHTLEPGAGLRAPSLSHIVGTRLGDTPFPDYSPAFRNRTETWTPERLARFIADPAQVVPGTTMPDPGIDQPGEVRDLVGFLAAMTSPMVFKEGKR